MAKHARTKKADRIKVPKALKGSRKPEITDFQRVLHELQVHQEELEVQNAELRKTQQLLEQSRDRYAELYDFAPVGYLTLDGAGVIREANLTAAKWLGQERLQLAGTPFVQFVAPSERQRFRRHLVQCKGAISPVSTELTLFRDASARAVELISSRAEPLAGGAIYRLAITDISERRKADRKFKGLIESAPDAMVVVNGGGKIVLVNAQTEKLFGYARAELLGQTVEMLLPERYRAAHTGQRAQFFAKPKVLPMDARPKLYALSKDGVEIPVEISLSPLETEEGTLVSGAIRDISARVEAAKALESAHRQLRELSAHLESAREEERTRIARELHDDLGATFLTIKMGLSAYLEENAAGLGPERADKLRDILEQVDTGIDSVRRIATDLRPSILDTLGVAAAIEWYAQDLERRTGIEFEVATDGCERTLNMEKERASALFRIVKEGLTNVVRHSKATRVRISMKVNARGLELKIEDNGKGFVPDRPRARPAWGLVGMSERAKALGGELKVTSALHHGTTVSLQLPN